MAEAKKLWGFSLPRVRNVLARRPLLHEGMVWASLDWSGRSTAASVLLALDPATGREHWRVAAQGINRDPLEWPGGAFWPRMAPPGLLMVDASGDTRWERDLGDGNAWVAAVVSAGAVVRDSRGMSWLLGADGALRWEYQDELVPTLTELTDADAELYIAPSHFFEVGVVVARRCSDGAPVWRTTNPNRYLSTGPASEGRHDDALVPLFDQQSLRLLRYASGQEVGAVEVWPQRVKAHLTWMPSSEQWVLRTHTATTAWSELVVVRAASDGTPEVCWRQTYTEKLASDPVALSSGEWAALQADGNILLIDPQTGQGRTAGKVTRGGDDHAHVVARDGLVIATQGREVVSLSIG